MSEGFKVIADAKPGTGWTVRNDNRAMISCKDHESILSGVADSGKSITCCILLHLMASRYPGSQYSLVRKTAASIASTVARTFMRVVSGQQVRVIGASKPIQFQYANGSIIWLGGMDKPDKILSGERDGIYVCQAEELTLNDWETLATRCSGRGAIVKYPRLFGDCNTSGSKHWIKQRANEGKLKLLVAKHVDNPTLFDDNGILINTDEVRRRMAVLENLTGVRRKRLLEGIWATAEGAVYDNFDATIGRHVKRRSYSEMKRMFLCMDEGFTNPAVILEVGEDSDGRWHIFREFYKRNVLPEDHVLEAKKWWEYPIKNNAILQGTEDYRPPFEVCVVDAAAAGFIASLKTASLHAVGGKGRVADGIASIKNRLKFQADGLPRLTVDHSCKETINEFESYKYKDGKDVPEKEFDHAVDCVRYLSDHFAEPTGAFKTAEGIHVGPNAVQQGAIQVRHFVPRRLG